MRRIIRKNFKGLGKVSVEGNRREYRFDPNEPVTQEIMAECKSNDSKETEKPVELGEIIEESESLIEPLEAIGGESKEDLEKLVKGAE